MSGHIRPATPTDENRVGKLFLEMLCTIHPGVDHRGYAPGDLDRYFIEGENKIFLWEEDGSPVAFLSLEIHREEKVFAYVDDFCVTVSHRGKDIGHALLAHAEAYTWSCGVGILSLHVEKYNTATHHLYDSLGFSLYEDTCTQLLLAKELA